MRAVIERHFTAPAAVVWDVIGEKFGDMSWSSGIDSSHLVGELGVGAERVCSFEPNMFSKNGEVREKLLSFDRETHAFSYEAKMPRGAVKGAVNRWQIVKKDDGGCIVRMDATLEFRGFARVMAPLMGSMLKKMGRQTLAELEAHIQAV